MWDTSVSPDVPTDTQVHTLLIHRYSFVVTAVVVVVVVVVVGERDAHPR